MIKVGIIEGSGYQAGELIRILLHHPDVHLAWVSSRLNADKPVSAVHRGLIGDTDMRFTDEPPLAGGDVDAVIACGNARAVLPEDWPQDIALIDMTEERSGEHAATLDVEEVPNPLNTVVYGLPERNRKPLVRGARRAVCPAPLAMALELALLPLAKNLMLNSDVHATAVVGSSEAGASLNEDTHSSRNDNIIPSALLSHDDLPEVTALLAGMQHSFTGKIHLVEMSGPFSRGIIAVAYLDCPVEMEELSRLYADYYDDHNFTFISERVPDLKDVVNTNKCLLHLSKSGSKLVVVSVIDNLLKGAAGNAVHLLNLMFGLAERTGLDLKASAF